MRLPRAHQPLLGCQLPDGLPLRVQILGDIVVDELGKVLLALDREAGAAAARDIVALNADIVCLRRLAVEVNAVDVALVRTRQVALRRVRLGINRNGSAVTVQSQVPSEQLEVDCCLLIHHFVARSRVAARGGADNAGTRHGAPCQDAPSLIAFTALSRKNALIVEPTSRTY